MEKLEVFNRANRLVGRACRSQIHRFGLIHRAAHVFVLDPQGRLYLQLRQDTKDQYPGHWDSAAAGHVEPGEDYRECARRELAEELGLTEDIQPVVEVSASAATGWEHVALFSCVTERRPRPNPEEIAAGRFFSRAEVEQLLAGPGPPVTPALRLLYDRWRRAAGEAGAAR